MRLWSRVGLLCVPLAAIACGGGSGNPSPNPGPTIAPTPVATAVLASVKSEWADWIARNHAAIRTTDPKDTDYSDLRFLLPLIARRRVVAIGESGHGVGEFDAMKVRLIQFLHEEAGYDVIAFESGVYECFRADEQATTLAPLDVMRHSIFGVWHASETRPLFEYLAQTKKTARPLVLAGFDNQISSITGVASRPLAFRNALDGIDPGVAGDVEQADNDLLKHSDSSLEYFTKTEGDRVNASYDAATAAFDENRQALARTYADRPLLPLVLRQSAWSMPRYIDEIRNNYSSRIRDEAMATNVDELLDRFFPNQKVILWAHNVHLQHDANPVYGFPNMGHYLAERRGEQMYVIGLFMHQGQAAQNDRKVYDIGPPQPDSLEAVMSRTGTAISFVDLLNQTRVPGNTWMFDGVPFKDWGVNDMWQVPRAQFDGILFVDTVHPPHYI
jgi:erythromycin esterase